jgi:hypothetical protein
MIIKIDNKGRIPLKYFKDVIDIDKVDSYTVDQKGNGLIVTFYDKSGNKILPKEGILDQRERRAIDEIKSQTNIEVPWHVYRILGIDDKILVLGDQVSFSENGDFASLDEVRSCIDWLAYQFGGKVKWEDS